MRDENRGKHPARARDHAKYPDHGDLNTLLFSAGAVVKAQPVNPD
jgi:hypothetical protein